jgi:hypothetical protein
MKDFFILVLLGVVGVLLLPLLPFYLIGQAVDYIADEHGIYKSKFLN